MISPIVIIQRMYILIQYLRDPYMKDPLNNNNNNNNNGGYGNPDGIMMDSSIYSILFYDFLKRKFPCPFPCREDFSNGPGPLGARGSSAPDPCPWGLGRGPP